MEYSLLELMSSGWGGNREVVPLPWRVTRIPCVTVMSHISRFTSFFPAAVSMSLSDKENLKRPSSLKIWVHSGNFQDSGGSSPWPPRAANSPPEVSALSGSSISWLGHQTLDVEVLAQVLSLFGYCW